MKNFLKAIKGLKNPLEKGDCGIIVFCVLVLLFSIAGLLYNTQPLSYAAVGLVDLYFIAVIFYAARRSDVHKDETWYWSKFVPNKFTGVIVFFILYFSAIIGFAEIFQFENAPDYLVKKQGQSPVILALYKSTVAITSLSFENYGDEKEGLQFLQMWQSFNGILLLTATFGFLISRISSFVEKHTLEEVHTIVQGLKNNQPELSRVEKQALQDVTVLKKAVNNLETRVETLESQNLGKDATKDAG